jgi:hypothetical protein
MAAAWLSRGSGLVVPQFFLARRGQLIANNARGAAGAPVLLAVSDRVYPAALVGCAGLEASPCICRMKAFWSYCSSVSSLAGWPDKSYGGRIRTHRRSGNRHYRRVYWRLVAASNRHPSRYRHCLRDHQRCHWRGLASACGWASAGSPRRRLGRRLGQTPMVVAVWKKRVGHANASGGAS